MTYATVTVLYWQVAPAELEAVLLTHPAVADCAVVGISDERAGELPKALVVVKERMSCSDHDITSHVAGKNLIHLEVKVHPA